MRFARTSQMIPPRAKWTVATGTPAKCVKERAGDREETTRSIIMLSRANQLRQSKKPAFQR